jgi:DNA-binding MarR family transcriptional regulator
MPSATGGPSAAEAARAAREVGAPIEADLGWALGVVFRGYLKSAGAAVADLPGGPRGFQVLTAAAGSGCGSQLALAQQLGIDRTVMTYLLDDLEKAGLVVRRADPADRRACQVAVTEAGRARLVELDWGLRAVEEHILAVLEPADRDAFRSLLQQLATDAALSTPTSASAARTPLKASPRAADCAPRGHIFRPRSVPQ